MESHRAIVRCVKLRRVNSVCRVVNSVSVYLEASHNEETESRDSKTNMGMRAYHVRLSRACAQVYT